MEINDLINLQSSWESYFNAQKHESKENREIIYGIKSIHSREKITRAAENELKLYEINFLYPIFRTVVNRLSKNYYYVDIKDSENKYTKYTRIVTDVLEDSKEELLKCIENLASDGYCVLFITKDEYSDNPSIKYINDSYCPFFDKFSLKDTMCDGYYCGYKVCHSINTFKNIYGVEAAKRETSYNNDRTQELIQGIEVYYAWVKEDKETIIKYEYTRNQILTKNNSLYKNLPLIFIPVVSCRDSTEIRLENIAKISKNSSELLNNILNIITSHIRYHQTYYLIDKLTIDDELKAEENYINPNRIVKYYNSKGGDASIKSAPIVVSPVNSPREALELFNITLNNLNSTWSTAIDVTLSSKYDTIAVLNEKQREADKGTSTNKLSHSWAIGMESVIRSLLSMSGMKKNDIKKVNIRETLDIQRQNLMEIETISNIIPVVKSDVVQIQLLIMMLEIRDDKKYKDAIEILKQSLQASLMQMETSSKSPSETEVRMAIEEMKGFTQNQIQDKQTKNMQDDHNFQLLIKQLDHRHNEAMMEINMKMKEIEILSKLNKKQEIDD